MMGLRKQLRDRFDGRLCLMGIGNVECGDDGFGVRLAQSLEGRVAATVVIAETTPERHLSKMSGDSCDDLVFLDAVECGQEPGSIVFLDAAEISRRFPQVSTHKVALSTLAQWARSNGVRKTWLLGAQPQTVQAGAALSFPVEQTIAALSTLMSSLSSEVSRCQ